MRFAAHTIWRADTFLHRALTVQLVCVVVLLTGMNIKSYAFSGYLPLQEVAKIGVTGPTKSFVIDRSVAVETHPAIRGFYTDHFGVGEDCIRETIVSDSPAGSDHHNAWISAFWSGGKIEFWRQRMGQRFGDRLNLQFVSGGLPDIDKTEPMNKSLMFNTLNQKVFTDDVDVRPQLHFGSPFSPLYESTRGPPEQPSCTAQYDCEESYEGVAMAVKPGSETKSSSSVDDEETADVFLRGIAAYIILMLLDAGLKRW
jgi:hypothetical protein